MQGSIRLFKFAGIQVYVHWSFWLLILWIISSAIQQGEVFLGIIEQVAFVFSLFLCVTFHEFGHALMARRFGIDTKDINLLPIGGIARLEKMPEKPIQEFLVAIAGPLVNVVIAIILFIGLYYSVGIERIYTIIQRTTKDSNEAFFGSSFLITLFEANIILVIFNLIPAFPMDGGRILRSLLSAIFGYKKGTQAASIIGQLISLVFIGVGLFYGELTLSIIGAFILMGARSEAKQVNQKEFTVTDIPIAAFLPSTFTSIYENERVGSAYEVIENGKEESYLVVNSQNEPVGITQKGKLLNLIELGQSFTHVQDIMQKTWEKLRPNDSIQYAIDLMKTSDLDIHPVFNENEFIGVVKQSEIENFLNTSKKANGPDNSH